MILVSDIITRARDHAGNYATGVLDDAQYIRGVDNSVNSLFRKLGGKQKSHTFLYSADTIFYDLPEDFIESIGLYYTDVNYNLPENAWSYKPYQTIKRKTGKAGGQEFAYTNINGKKQLMLLGNNIYKGAVIDPMDTELWQALGDADDIEFDTNIKVQGSASQKFSIIQNTDEAVIRRTFQGMDFSTLHSRFGQLRIYSFLTSTDLENIQIRYGTDSLNYFTITTTTNANSLAWEENDWNLLSFSTINKVITGSPDDSNINFVEIVFNLEAGFGTVNNFRLDWFYTVFPDEMESDYYSNIKGKDTSGTDITKITSTTDEIDADDEYIEPLALKTALYIWPQLRGDINFMSIYKSDYTEWVKDLGRSQPRIRNQNNFQPSRLRR